MTRGTFANMRLANALAPSAGARTVHLPSGAVLDVYDAARRYGEQGTPLLVLAGAEYGCGSPRDWAAKGPALLVSGDSADAALESLRWRPSRGTMPGVGATRCL